PMNLDQKKRLFRLLCDIGFKEIEIGFPSASQVDFDFARILVEENMIPDDVTIQVLTQAREHLIRRTYEALEGVDKAIVHMYNSTSTLQRDVVFNMNKEEIIKIAVDGASLVKQISDETGNPGIRFEYSPESFTGTEMDYALDVCHAVMDVLKPTPEKRLILNLPATVEMSTPNIHADQIEWFCNNIRDRDSVIISLHAHNDRGTAVAATELGIMAGADRVEGTLFGNGERTGNLDIVTTALNIFSQGVDPELDFSSINFIKDEYISCTRMPVHPRHPYAGDLVYTAFSGSHQDAINKGFNKREERNNNIWEVPYLPINPKDVGRSYQSIIRINSQSGKGGVAYLMDSEFGYKLPKAMQVEFSKVIQRVTEESGSEISSRAIWESFNSEYLEIKTPYELKHIKISMDSDSDHEATEEVTLVSGLLNFKGKDIKFSSEGNGPIDAFIKGLNSTLNEPVKLKSYDEHNIDGGSDSLAVSYISLRKDKGSVRYGVGTDSNISMASIKAIVSALNRLSK
ncbi:MAG: 2-isopropylmalate synthase, partial [Spirochaetales bacterium]|nr:2-isopropylmalate synthase [Spirochaetales bacterium]